MTPDIIEVNVVENYKIQIRFEDGAEGVVDIKELIPFSGIFEPLKNIDYFNTVKINPELGTICWDNGADISPEKLYVAVTADPE